MHTVGRHLLDVTAGVLRPRRHLWRRVPSRRLPGRLVLLHRDGRRSIQRCDSRCRLRAPDEDPRQAVDASAVTPYDSATAATFFATSFAARAARAASVTVCSAKWACSFECVE